MRSRFVYLLILLLLVSVVAADSTCVTYFYGEGCKYCTKVGPFLDQVEMKYSEVEVNRLEIYNNRENIKLLFKFYEAYNVHDDGRGVPIVFVGNRYLSGPSPITNDLENLLQEYEGVGCAYEDENGTIVVPLNHVGGQVGDVSPTSKLETLSWMTVIGAAIVDSINPCAIAVLLILISGLLVSGDKKRALKAGLAFTLSIYIVYFLFGLGLFSALQWSGLASLFYKVIGFIAVLIGLANIKDYFWYGGGGFVMEIPRGWRPYLKKFLHSVTSPFGAFLSGFVVCLFELPCTGGPYIFILGLLAEKTTQMTAIPILLVYNLFFVLPLLVITLLLYIGQTNVDSANKWKDRNIRMLHLVAGIVMTLLGLMVLMGWV